METAGFRRHTFRLGDEEQIVIIHHHGGGDDDDDDDDGGRRGGGFRRYIRDRSSCGFVVGMDGGNDAGAGDDEDA